MNNIQTTELIKGNQSNCFMDCSNEENIYENIKENINKNVSGNGKNLKKILPHLEKYGMEDKKTKYEEMVKVDKQQQNNTSNKLVWPRHRHQYQPTEILLSVMENINDVQTIMAFLHVCRNWKVAGSDALFWYRYCQANNYIHLSTLINTTRRHKYIPNYGFPLFPHSPSLTSDKKIIMPKSIRKILYKLKTLEENYVKESSTDKDKNFVHLIQNNITWIQLFGLHYNIDKHWEGKKNRLRPLYSMTGHRSIILSVKIDTLHQEVLSGGQDGKLRINSLNHGGKCWLEQWLHYREISQLACNGDTLYSASWDGTIRQWQRECDSTHTHKPKKLKSLRTYVHDQAVVSMKYKRQCLVSGTCHGLVYVWQSENGQCLAKLKFNGIEAAVNALDFDNHSIYVGLSHQLVVWSRKSLTVSYYFSLPSGDQLTTLAYHHGQLIVGLEDGTFQLWKTNHRPPSPSTWDQIPKVVCQGHTESIRGLNVSGDKLFTCSNDGVN